MDTNELKELIAGGESSKVQFKERITDASKLSYELVAFSNTKGGILLVGVNDKTGSINGLSFEEVAELNKLVANVTTNNVKPSITVQTETVRTPEGSVVIIEITQGVSRPYKDNSGAIWVKNGSDKRKVLDNIEIARLLQSSKVMYADEMPIEGCSLDEVDKEYYKKIYANKYGFELDKSAIDLHTSLRNQQLAKGEQLTLAGLLLFSDRRDDFRPLFTVHCFSIYGTSLIDGVIEDSEPPFMGKLGGVYQQTMKFISRNIRKRPSGTSFNSELEWEIPQSLFEEVIVNALVHRDYFVNAKIQVTIYTDRIEVISPGVLPNSQTIDTIASGVSIPRNPVLQSLAQYVLPYKGAGTGLMRARRLYPEIQFVNDTKKGMFVVVIPRK